MNIPLDRLYHYINTQAQAVYGDSVIIYRFWPHGSKKLQNLEPIEKNYDWFARQTSPQILCHDQEPLDYDYYDHAVLSQRMEHIIKKNTGSFSAYAQYNQSSEYI